MKRILLCTLALLLAVCCGCNETPTPQNSTPTELDPIKLPTASEVANVVTLGSTLPAEPSADALAQAVDARIATLLAATLLPVLEPAILEGSVLVSYLGVLQEPLTPREELAGVLQPTVRGEAMLPVSVDPDALVGAEAGDKDIPLNILDPTVFALDAYEEHSILFHVQILQVYRAPKDLAEAEAFFAQTGHKNPIDKNAIRAEERAKLLWSEAIASAQVGELPAEFVAQIASEFVASHHNLYLSSATADTNATFSKWLSLHTDYADEAALGAHANAIAEDTARALFVACAVLDSCGARETLPDYINGCTPLANEAGYTSARFYTWWIGGSAIGWQKIIAAHYITHLSSQTA